MIHIYDGNNVMRRAMDAGIMAMKQMRPMTLRQRYYAAQPNQIWVWDGKHHNARRQDIYPQYKRNRPPTPMETYAQINLFKEIMRHSPAAQLEVEGWEADDVINTLARRFEAGGQAVTIHSNDMDYAQLEHHPLIALNGVDTKGVPGRWVPLYKAFRGDSSDNINGVPGFGPKRWVEMKNHWPEMERAIVNGSVEGLTGLPFKPQVIAWFQEPGNIELLQAMLLVTHFDMVPEDELEGGVIEGVPDPAKADARLREFFL